MPPTRADAIPEALATVPTVGADSLYGLASQSLVLVGQGGPLAIFAFIIGGFMILGALILAAPRLAEAWAIAKGGATRREKALARENDQLRSELTALEGKVSILEHHGEELRTVVLALVEQVERQMTAAGQDVGIITIFKDTLSRQHMPFTPS